MFKKIIKFICPVLLVIPLVAIVSAQDGSQKDPFIDHKEFKSKIFELKQRDPGELYNILRPLMSGWRGAELTYNSDMKTISVRDLPENIASIEEALKRLDVPRVARPESSIELSMHILLGNTSASGGQLPGEVPENLKDVVKQLQSTFTFKNYHLVTTLVQRASGIKRNVGGSASSGSGDVRWEEVMTDGGGSRRNQNASTYTYDIRAISVATDATGTPIVRLDDFSFHFGKTGVHTDLQVRDGEKLVVGTANIGDKALILVLTAKVLK